MINIYDKYLFYSNKQNYICSSHVTLTRWRHHVNKGLHIANTMGQDKWKWDIFAHDLKPYFQSFHCTGFAKAVTLPTYTSLSMWLLAWEVSAGYCNIILATFTCGYRISPGEVCVSAPHYYFMLQISLLYSTRSLATINVARRICLIVNRYSTPSALNVIALLLAFKESLPRVQSAFPDSHGNLAGGKIGLCWW